MLSDNAVTILEKRYLKRDDNGNVIEKPDEMFWRVARALAAPEEHNYGGSAQKRHEVEGQFYELMSSLKFLPNSPTLANAGARQMSYSACFVLPVQDDLASIFNSIRDAALIHQAGGGTGFAFSRLRPRNDRVQSTKGVASGPVSFIDVFNAATEVIKQGGMRRGANMGILRIDHPDILEFIRRKADLTKLTNFNVSVALTQEYMEALFADSDYPLKNPTNGEVVGYLNAAEVFDEIVEKAWFTGEPGIIFIDRMNEDCPVPWIGSYEATNPCGEQPLIPYESCNLGSINLEKFVVESVYDLGRQGDYEPGMQGCKPHIDWYRLKQAVHLSVRLLDNVIDANWYPLKEIEHVTKATRKIGLGVMGFAKMLYKMGIAYGSSKSLELAGELMSFIDYHSKVASVELAKKRGKFSAMIGHEQEFCAIFDKWAEKRQSSPNRHFSCDYISLANEVKKHGIRNSTTTTVAPTGTLSIIADTSGGCEPVFALAFKRYQADTEMNDVDKVFMDELVEKLGNEQANRVVEKIVMSHGSLLQAVSNGHINEQGKMHKLHTMLCTYITAHDVTPLDHVNIQAAFQTFNDSATSKTINFPKSATKDDVKVAYMRAWLTGCKGITVYRDGSREFQPLSTPIPVLPSDQAAATCCAHPSITMSEGCWTCSSCGLSGCSV